ncbi:MAG: alkaline phosphatase family protein [Actinobacteria bacterium]|nr:alkaline phosphatase family protein [Actinomycetota bacterium]
MPHPDASRLRRALVAGTLAAMAAATLAIALRRSPSEGAEAARRVGEQQRSFATDDPLERACGLEPVFLTRIWRGSDGVHDQDIIFVPHEPNYVGTFEYTSHTGPWDYVAEVPLVLYGPGIIQERGRVDRPVTLADVYPTVGRLLGLQLPHRDGETLTEAVASTGATPKLIVTIMWDAVGNNVLSRWSGSWPELGRLGRGGVSYGNATIGSSPSITPATHSTLGTGAFPRNHGVTSIKYRTGGGVLREAFDGIRPQDLKLTTYGDDVDRLLGNEPKVGLVAWQPWHIGMASHGAQLPGGDRDDLGLITGATSGAMVETNPHYYSLPWDRPDPPGLQSRIDEVDRRDGEVDGLWQGQEIAEHKNNPAWIEWQTDLMIDLIEQKGYGDDEVPDLLFANFKATDLVAHQLTMDAPQMELVLEAQDAALGRLVRHLENTVEDFVVIVTADHGSTPAATRSGAWPISTGELTRDLNRHFAIPDGDSLVETMPAHGVFIDHAVADGMGIGLEEIARFLNGYTIADNSTEDLPPGYEERAGEPVFEAAFPTDMLDAARDCALEAS